MEHSLNIEYRYCVLQKFSPGRVLDIFCRGCHHKMQFAAESVKLSHVSAPGVDTAKCRSTDIDRLSLKAYNE